MSPDTNAISEGTMRLAANKPPPLLIGEMNSCRDGGAPDLFKRVQPHPAGFSFVRLTVGPDDYRGISIPDWCIGRVLKSYDSSVCEFGDASLQKRTVHAGEVAVVPPNTPFRSVSTSASELEYIILTQARFDQALGAQHVDSKIDAYRGRPIFEALASSTLLASLFSTIDQPEAFDARHAGNYVNAIISDILLVKSPRLSGPLTRSRKLSAHEFKLISEFVHANLDKPLTNERLARLLDMPEATFARQFKATAKLAPYQFVLNCRVEHARHLLVTTTWPIAQIAFECGFSSQSHFTTTFKARIGATPNALRQTFAAH